MLRYLGRRALSNLVALVIFLTFMFFLTELMVPSDFTTQFSLVMSEAEREEMAEELGINRSMWARYLSWAKRLLRFDLGTSFYGPPVTQQLKSVFPYTLLVFMTGTVLAFTFGQWLGKLTAWRSGSLVGRTVVFSGIMLYTAFPPWLVFLVTYVAGRLLKLVDTPFYVVERLDRAMWDAVAWTPNQIMYWMILSLLGGWGAVILVNCMTTPRLRAALPARAKGAFIVGLAVGSWHLLGFGPLALDILLKASLPIITFVALSFGETMLIMRTSMFDTLREQYVTTARAKGLPDRQVRDKYVARNALLPVFSRLIVSLPYILTGLVIVEYALNWPGISSTLFESLYQQDIPTVMGSFLIVGVLAAVARLGLDVLYAFLDPRIRYDAAQLRRIG